MSTAPLMQALSGDAGLGDNGRVYLVDSEGLVLSAPTHVASQQEPIRASQERIPMAPQTANGLRYTGLAGQEVVGAYAPVESSPWFVVAEIPISEAFSDIDRMRNAIIIATALFFVLLVIVAVLISRRVTQPLRVLSAGASQIGQGNLSHRIEVSGNDEIANLATAFNHMAGDLDTTQARMVEAERTADLRAFTENNVLQLKKLSQMGLAIVSAPNIESLMKTCTPALRQLMSVDASAIVLLDDPEHACNL
ncbi:MAG: HAMP domain-containing protein, partial [Chloroflexi bacterium]|nr:HAMP domain-containing protein [Chloroflexota bacterium]